MKKSLVLLDRDGVINRDSSRYIRTPEEWQALPGSLKAVAALNHSGYAVATVTNQSGVARGYFTEATLQQIHRKMSSALWEVNGHIDAIFYCPHLPTAGCLCRKPKPTLLLQACEHYNIPPRHSLMIGDSYKDIQAAWYAGITPILVRTGNGQQTETLLNQKASKKKVLVFDCLWDAVESIIHGS